MTALIPAQNNLSLEALAANIKVKLVENAVLEKNFYSNFNRNVIEIGENLRRMKSQLQHGQWQFWLAENFNMEIRTAQRYMKVAEYFGKNDNVVAFQPAALMELTKLTKQEVPKFLAAQKVSGVDVAILSVRQLQKKIKEWKSPSLPLTVDVQAEIATAPVQTAAPLKLPPPQFLLI